MYVTISIVGGDKHDLHDINDELRVSYHRNARLARTASREMSYCIFINMAITQQVRRSCGSTSLAAESGFTLAIVLVNDIALPLIKQSTVLNVGCQLDFDRRVMDLLHSSLWDLLKIRGLF